jgi:hypothetical protein
MANTTNAMPIANPVIIGILSTFGITAVCAIDAFKFCVYLIDPVNLHP